LPPISDTERFPAACHAHPGITIAAALIGLLPVNRPEHPDPGLQERGPSCGVPLTYAIEISSLSEIIQYKNKEVLGIKRK
jgi:hypothetical protein